MAQEVKEKKTLDIVEYQRQYRAKHRERINELAREYRKANREKISLQRQEKNRHRSILLKKTFGNVCFLCGEDIGDDKMYVLHHLSYEKDIEEFGKKISPFQKPEYVILNKENFVLLHRECHNAFHKLYHTGIKLEKVKELIEKQDF